MAEADLHEELLDLAEIAPDRIRRFTVDEYMQLVESGMFEDEKVELLAGVVVAMTAQGTKHIDFIVWLTRLLARRLPDDLRVAPQCTFQLSKYSAPEPDFVVVTAASMKKRPLKAVWMIEVAVTSQHKDRGIKARLYAAAGIPEYWVVDAKKLTVDIHRDPGRNGYRSITRHGELEQIAHRGFPSLVFSLRDLANDRVAV